MSDRKVLAHCRRTNRHNLLQVALDVRMTANGSYTRPGGEQKADVKILNYALKHWKKSAHPRAESFDAAVKLLMESALKECEL